MPRHRYMLARNQASYLRSSSASSGFSATVERAIPYGDMLLATTSSAAGAIVADIEFICSFPDGLEKLLLSCSGSN